MPLVVIDETSKQVSISIYICFCFFLPIQFGFFFCDFFLFSTSIYAGTDLINDRYNITYDLQLRHVFLPPQELGIFGTHGRHHIIEVHADMHKVIQEIGERCIAAYR